MDVFNGLFRMNPETTALGSYRIISTYWQNFSLIPSKMRLNIKPNMAESFAVDNRLELFLLQ